VQPLEQALALAGPDGWVQVFLDEGGDVRTLLTVVLAQDEPSPYARRVLERFPAPAASARRTPAVPGGLPLAAPLSRREIEILELLAQGYANKEIAQKTVSLAAHGQVLFQPACYNKLGVDGRMQAVNRARELGLL
jgi:LuxR family maltose regulon positive regulatory protein